MTSEREVLVEEIAGVLAEHYPRHTEYARDPDTLLCQPCSEARGDWVTWTTAHLADALADLLAARDRRVRAEALREAAAAVWDETGVQWKRPDWQHWLRERALGIEAP